MQSWCDFLSKCLSWYLYNPYGEKHRCSWDTWKTSFFRHNKRELLLGLPRKHQDAWSLHPMYPTNLKGNGLCNLQIYSASYGEKSGGPTRAVSPCENYQLLHKPIPWRPSFWGGSFIKNSLGSQSLIEKYETQLACALKIQTSTYLHYFFIFPVIKHWLVIMLKGLITPARNSSSSDHTSSLGKSLHWCKRQHVCSGEKWEFHGCMGLMVLMFLAELSWSDYHRVRTCQAVCNMLPFQN